MKKTAIITRAVPGSGKTTISNCIIRLLTSSGIKPEIRSTDEFFMTEDGRYAFDPTRLYDNHRKNLELFKKDLENGINVVICDNINLSPWQTRPYTDAARENGYLIILITFEPREYIKHNESQKITREKPDAHGVPPDVIVRMIREYYQYNSLLDKSMPVDPVTQPEYTWDSGCHKRVLTGNPSPHFDFDFAIRILPDEYKERQKTIGEQILKLIS